MYLMRIIVLYMVTVHVKGKNNVLNSLEFGMSYIIKYCLFSDFGKRFFKQRAKAYI